VEDLIRALLAMARHRGTIAILQNLPSERLEAEVGGQTLSQCRVDRQSGRTRKI
jgi:hypothetical protein